MRMVLRICNLVLWFLGIALMIVGVTFTIVAGGMEDINSSYDTHFEDLRTQYESEFPGLCDDMSNAECRDVLKEKTEDAALTIVIVVGITLGGYVVILYLTYQAVHIYRNLDKTIDSDSDDE